MVAADLLLSGRWAGRGSPPLKARTRQQTTTWPHTLRCAATSEGVASGPAGADGAVGARHVAAGGLHLLAVLVGLLVDHLEVATQLGDELLAGHRTGAAPKVAGRKHIADDGLVLGFQRGGLRADGGAVGGNIPELVVSRAIGV